MYLLALRVLAVTLRDTTASAKAKPEWNQSSPPAKHKAKPLNYTTKHPRITRRLPSPSGPPGPEGPPKKCVDGKIKDFTVYTLFTLFVAYMPIWPKARWRKNPNQLHDEWIKIAFDVSAKATIYTSNKMVFSYENTLDLDLTQFIRDESINQSYFYMS